MADVGSYRQFFLLDGTIKLLFQLGIAQSLYYFIPRDSRNADRYLINAICLNLLVFGSVYSVGYLSREHIIDIFHMEFLSAFYFQLAAYTILMMMSLCVETYLTARQQVREAAAFAVFGQLMVTIGVLLAAVVTRRLEVIFTALVVCQFLLVVTQLSFIMRKNGRLRLRVDLDLLRTQFRYGILLGLGGGAWVVLSRVHEYYVSGTRDVESFAVYSYGCTQIPIVQLYLQSTAAVTLGMFAQHLHRENWDAVLELWRKVLRNLLGVALPAVLFLVAISEPLIKFWLTPEYYDAITIFRVNALVKISSIWNAQLVLRAMNRNDLSLWVNGAWLLGSPLAFWVGDTLAGLHGVIWAQFFVMVGNRLSLMAVLNAVSPVRLPLIIGPREILGFYREILLGALRRSGAWKQLHRDNPSAGGD
jgi:O-antigen/teichoic acid export membrane protein